MKIFIFYNLKNLCTLHGQVFVMESWFGLKSFLNNEHLVLVLSNFFFSIITKTCPCNIQRIFSAVKIENFIRKMLIFFLTFAQNIDCGYTLEPPHRDGSNEYPQSMFWSKNKKK